MRRANYDVVLITDLDNTLYNLVDYFAPAFRAMVHALSRLLSVPEDFLMDEFRDVYRRHGSVEYSFSVQELATIRRLPPEQVEEAVHVGRVVFGGARRNRLKLYDGVKLVLQTHVAKGGKLCAITNAPAYQAYDRLRALGISKLFHAFCAWEGMVIPDSEHYHKYKHDKAMSLLDKRLMLSICEDKGQIKPNPSMITKVIAEFGGKGTEFYSIGDSLEKDLRPCADLGMKTIWARYGIITDPKNQHTLDSLTPWSKAEFQAHYSSPSSAEPFSPNYTIDSFMEVADILHLSYQQQLL